MEKKENSRREFIKKAALGSAGLALGFSAKSYGNILGANDRINIAVLGVNGRGQAHIEGYANIPNVQVTHVCDVEKNALQSGMEQAKKNDQDAEAVHDFREILNNKNLNAISIAMPDHWHTPAAILGCAAGKDVYVEKPCGHNPKEGEMLIEAVNKYDRSVQMGNQRRSWPNMIGAVQQIKQGIIGKVHYASGWYANNRKSIGNGKNIEVPSNLDWNLWQGPAPREDYRDNLVHYNWHWFWNWGTGESCNNATHEIDMMRWALGVDYPQKVVSGGGRYFYDDDWECTDTQNITFEFPDNKSISWEGRSCNPYPEGGSGRGFKIYGEKGTLVCLGGNEYTAYDNDEKVIKKSQDTKNTDTINTMGPGARLDAYHFQNFIETMRGNQNLNAPITEGHKSVLLCHLGNIAQRTGHTLHCSPEDGGHIVDNSEAMKLWGRNYESGWEPKV